MPKIVRLEASKHIKGRVLVFFEDAELIKLTENEVLLHQLYAGKELSSVEYQALTQRARLTSAKYRAAQLVSRKLVSRGELVQRLGEKGVRPEDCEAAAQWLEELGMLDDARCAATVARHYARKGYGRKKIESELFRRKLPRTLWAQALSELGDGAEELDRLVERRLRGRFPDEKELKRLQGYLLRRGYDWQQVKEALERCGARSDAFEE
jgi:regulatory protein